MSAAQWKKYFDEHPDERATPEESYAEMYGIRVDQIARHKELSAMKMSQWPAGLYDFVRLYTQRHGACGEVIISGIGAWLAQGGQ
jgi:hypothetical protein